MLILRFLNPSERKLLFILAMFNHEILTCHQSTSLRSHMRFQSLVTRPVNISKTVFFLRKIKSPTKQNKNRNTLADYLALGFNSAEAKLAEELDCIAGGISVGVLYCFGHGAAKNSS